MEGPRKKRSILQQRRKDHKTIPTSREIIDFFSIISAIYQITEAKLKALLR